MLSLLTRTKSFQDPWVGHRELNARWQLHRHRLSIADALCRWRRFLRPGSAVQLSAEQRLQLHRDGCLEIRDLLPAMFSLQFRRAEELVARKANQHPPVVNDREGFQPKQPFSGGFDRFDGGTLNRFLHIEPVAAPHTARVCRDPRFSVCSRQVIGLPMDPRKLDLYLTVHGEECRTPDLGRCCIATFSEPQVLVVSTAGATGGRPV